MPTISQMFTWLLKKNYIMNKAEEYMPTQGKKEFYPIEEHSLIMP